MFIFFSYDEQYNQWIAQHLKYPDFRAVTKGGSVLGPQEWTMHNDSKLCDGSASYTYTTKLSLSSCSSDQFTCSDGNCVDIGKRLSSV